MAKNRVLGKCACPLCGFAEQEIRETGNGKPYIICDECGMQLFARQARSVRILLDRAAAPAAPVAKPAPAAPAAPVAKQGSPELPTMFDLLLGNKKTTTTEEGKA